VEHGVILIDIPRSGKEKVFCRLFFVYGKSAPFQERFDAGGKAVEEHSKPLDFFSQEGKLVKGLVVREWHAYDPFVVNDTVDETIIVKL
jgi:hypothetical protein